MVGHKFRPEDSRGIVQLKYGGIIYRAPWSRQVIFQHNDIDLILGFEMFSLSPDRYKDHQAYRILYEGEEAYIMEWDAGEFFERPKLPERNEDS